MLPCLWLISDVLILYFHNKLGRLNNFFRTGDREIAFISSHSLTQFPPFVDVNFHCRDKYKNVHALFLSSQNGNCLRSKLSWFAHISTLEGFSTGSQELAETALSQFRSLEKWDLAMKMIVYWQHSHSSYLSAYITFLHIKSLICTLQMGI